MNEPGWYVKKPIRVQALMWTGDNTSEVWAFAGNKAADVRVPNEPLDVLLIYTLEGWLTAQRGDWIVRGIEGEFYPVKDSVFAATYEPVTPEALPGHLAGWPAPSGGGAAGPH